MSDWRDNVSEELPGFGLGQLEGDDTLDVAFQDDGEEVETVNGDAVRFHVTVEGCPDGYQAMDDTEIQQGEDYYLMSSSNRFLSSLMEIGDNLEGQTVSISSEGSDFDRTYNVE